MEQGISGMLTPPVTAERAALMPADALAFIGDAAYQLLVADMLVKGHDAKSGALHALATRYVGHAPQSEAAARSLPLLTEDETAVYRRGRNMSVRGAKRGDGARHAAATGLEALFGYLCVTGQDARMRALFQAIIDRAT